jgi:hypothetical protein
MPLAAAGLIVAPGRPHPCEVRDADHRNDNGGADEA